jgi:hypothetical protein
MWNLSKETPYQNGNPQTQNDMAGQKSQQNRQYGRDNTIPDACLRIFSAVLGKVCGQTAYNIKDNNR